MVSRRAVLETSVVTLAMSGVDSRSRLHAQQSGPQPTAEAEQPVQPDIEVLPANPLSASGQADERSSRIATAAFLLLMGIVALGVLLLATVLLLGSRARRLVRQPLPEIPPQDPDWFLRKKLEPPDVSPPPSED